MSDGNITKTDLSEFLVGAQTHHPHPQDQPGTFDDAAEQWDGLRSDVGEITTCPDTVRGAQLGVEDSN